MIGTQLGPYTVLSELGSGGMGTVYLAEVSGEAPGIDPGSRVALKIVHPHLLSTPGFFKRFLREAEIGKRVRHENVVRTIDVDAILLDGRQLNYMVLEYVAGKSLRALLHDLGTVPEALVREIALQMAAGLGAIHGDGIVHRDLKPENVLITDDQCVRIMDLGVAKLQEASVALTRDDAFAGSFLYAAPEQFRGGAVGAAADLYSMGVLLYELATGENPFRRDSTAGVIQAHLAEEASPACERNPLVSAYLSEILGVLLAKVPAQRLESAARLHALLEEGEGSSWWAERERTLRARAERLPPIQVRREVSLHARGTELDELGTIWSRAKAGQGSVLLVEGEAGIGKTRLVDAFARSLEEEDVHVLYGAYPPSGGMGGISDAVIGKFGATGLAARLAPYLTVTPTLAPAFAALLKHETPPTGAEPLRGDALHAVTCHLMRALAAEKPTLWILDDLNFAPAESRQLVLSMARAAGPHRVMLLLTARPGLAQEDLAQLGRLESFHRVALRRLGAREVIELLRESFKSEALAEKLGGKIAFKSDGVPFFILELVRDLRNGSLLKQLPDGTYVETQQITDIEVPSAVRDLLSSRLKDLTREERATLDVGAVEGIEFDPDLVARALERKRVRVLQDLAEIERRTGIVLSTGRAYRFDQHQMHEILLSELSAGLREEYHTLLAEAYAEREGEGVAGEGALFLAWHHLHGGEPRAGVPYLVPALDFLPAAERGEIALALMERALADPRLLKGADRLAILFRKAARLAGLGRHREIGPVLDEALALADKTGDLAWRARARCRRARHFTEEGREEEARRGLDAALELARRSGDRALVAEVTQDFGGILWELRRYEEARPFFEETLAIFSECGDRGGEANATNGLGIVAHNLGRYAEAKGHYERCLALGRDHGHDGMISMALGNRGLIYSVLGQFALARQDLEEALVIRRQQGSRITESYLLHELGELAEREGDLEGAVRFLEEAARVRREAGERRLYPLTLVAQGRVAAARGDSALAVAKLDAAIAQGRELKLAMPCVVGGAYRALFPGGDAKAALDALREYDPRLRERERYEARFVLWQATQDRVHLDEAHRLLMDLRDHAPEECRETMIDRVPLHRAIVTAHGGLAA